jgi:hypothetical protein
VDFLKALSKQVNSNLQFELGDDDLPESGDLAISMHSRLPCFSLLPLLTCDVTCVLVKYSLLPRFLLLLLLLLSLSTLPPPLLFLPAAMKKYLHATLKHLPPVLFPKISRQGLRRRWIHQEGTLCRWGTAHHCESHLQVRLYPAVLRARLLSRYASS